MEKSIVLTNSELKKNNKSELYQCPVYLFCNYELLELSAPKIAEECGVSGATIRNWLKKYDIRIRPRSETLKGKTGVNHPLYGKHWSEERKDKMRGKNHPLYGKHRSEETKKKISDSMKGKHWFWSEEFKKKKVRGKKMKKSTGNKKVPIENKNQIFRTWDNWCLQKLREMGKSTLKQWANAMGYNYAAALSLIIKRNQDKLKITPSPSTNLRAHFFEVRQNVVIPFSINPE